MTLNCTATCDVCLLDTETPLGVYLKIREHFNQPIFFETNPKEPGSVARAYICFEPMAGISVKDGLVTTFRPGAGKQAIALADQEVVPAVVAFFDSISVEQSSGQALPGLFGYMSYSAVRYFETINLPVNASEPIPDIRYDLYRYTIVIDPASHELSLYTLRCGDDARDDRQHVLSVIRNKQVPHYPFRTTSTERCDADEATYLEQVARGKNACKRGDVFQVVLSRSFETDYQGDDMNVFRKLKSVNPSPYTYYCDYNGFRLFGASPETQFRLSEGKASIRPIAGTYRRTGDRQKDSALAAQLKEDHKENAEHVMLVDLARNDLSRHYAHVNLRDARRIEQYSHVMHMTSVVEADTPVNDVHPFRILADTFPAGTLSGAPKHRAMQLIGDIERSTRGFYGGCVGFIGFDGSIDTAILIRSFLSIGHTLRYRAGAGITVHSDPRSELQEIDHKIGALRTAIKLAHETIDH